MVRPVSVLYHCNELEKCVNFVENNDYTITKIEDGIWLGNGMYFWDNISNAEYWKRQKIRKDSSKKYAIVKVSVYTDHILDLTDNNVCEMLSELWAMYKSKISVPDNKEETLGFKLNCLYDYFDKFIEKYHIIKTIGKYNLSPPNKLFSYNLNNNIVEPITSVKCIYSVRNKECIILRSLEGNDDGEKK